MTRFKVTDKTVFDESTISSMRLSVIVEQPHDLVIREMYKIAKKAKRFKSHERKAFRYVAQYIPSKTPSGKPTKNYIMTETMALTLLVGFRDDHGVNMKLLNRFLCHTWSWEL